MELGCLGLRTQIQLQNRFENKPEWEIDLGRRFELIAIVLLTQKIIIV